MPRHPSQASKLFVSLILTLPLFSCKPLDSNHARTEKKQTLILAEKKLAAAFLTAEEISPVEMIWFDYDVSLTWEQLHNEETQASVSYLVWALRNDESQAPQLDQSRSYEIDDRLPSGHELIYQGELLSLRLIQSPYRRFWVTLLMDGRPMQTVQARSPIEWKTCASIQNEWPEAPNGLYKVYQSPADQFAYCDMLQGAWTLILNYFKKADHPTISASTLPEYPLLSTHARLGSASLGERQGHLPPSAIAALGAQELRFFCQSSRHDRTLHFRSDESGCLAYLSQSESAASCSELLTSWQPMPDHNAELPATMDGGLSEQGELALFERPFGVWGGASWRIPASDDGLWACDEIPAPLSPGDWLRFEVWIR
ncbi:MAG: hypothetical protein ACOH5I_21430 [Oligoflexus sp.]